MVRVLVIVAVVGFVLTIACFSGAAALGGRALAESGLPLPWAWGHWNWDDDDDDARPGDRDSPNATREIAWTGGEDLAIALPADVVFTQGPTAKLTVTGPKRVVDRVIVEDGKLRFAGRHGGRWGLHDARLQVAVSSPDTHSFSLAGSPNLRIADFKQDRLRVAIMGSGDVTGAGQAKRVDVAIFGSGDANLAGVAAEEADVKIMGSGDASVAPRDYADVAIFGSGDVDLAVRPAKLSSHIAGSGKVLQHDAVAAAVPPPAAR